MTLQSKRLKTTTPLSIRIHPQSKNTTIISPITFTLSQWKDKKRSLEVNIFQEIKKRWDTNSKWDNNLPHNSIEGKFKTAPTPSSKDICNRQDKDLFQGREWIKTMPKMEEIEFHSKFKIQTTDPTENKLQDPWEIMTWTKIKCQEWINSDL